MAYDFSGKVVLITGGTGALGRAVAQAFGTSNATTVVTYIIDEEREDVKSKIKTIAELVKADITKEDQAKKLVSHVIKTYDRIDVLVNVVGGYLGGKTVAELDETEWDKMMNMNLKSDGYDSAYSASKSGLIRLVESISEEVKEYNINVNCILPSTIDTEANRNAMPNSDFSKWVKTEDLANLVLFLCSDEAKVINGAAIPAYGLA